ncbi:DUF2274 domain-containing protein [Bradyrhizobium sp. 195]|uniref:DUF2274 domain-containing protein n=1 Tax=Bradyrhizobium sp. 195 TaxID=2782662 RepID=UPI002001B564|nr:DUF2274 domain-containing protein [Bradyrhizobium sp. 195]UPK28269.1 DUF2274 domain-containing protein [Bradyrhizobium sp. 195]
MTKLKLGPLEDDKPVKLTVELPAAVFWDLKSYADTLTRNGGATPVEPARLVAPMIERFMAPDPAFAKARRNAAQSDPGRPRSGSAREAGRGERSAGLQLSCRQ